MRGKERKRCLWREKIWPWGKEEGGVYREREKKEVEEARRTKIGLSEKWEKKQRKRDKYKTKSRYFGKRDKYTRKIIIKN